MTTSKLRQSFLYILIVFITAITLTGFGCRRQVPGGADSVDQELVVWGLWQESSQIAPIISAFTEKTGIKVNYKKIASVASYEKDLLASLAEGRGPDVFVIHHTWVNGKRGIMSPAPADIVDPRAVSDEFVDVVSKDMIVGGQVYALPTSVDSLALYYNRDLLNAAGVARPPATWTDFQQMVERVTKVNRVGVISQSAAALGAAANINRASDILQLLFLQSGLPIISESGDKIDIDNDIGQRSLIFYTDFANRAKRVFTWNLQQDFSIDSFAEGDTATMINYSYHLPTIKAKNPRLNFAIAPVPQIAGSSEGNRINFAAYWPFAVSNSSPAQRAAWTFVRYLTGPDAAKTLNNSQGAPPARREDVVALQRDPVIGVFAEQALTAKSWPRFDIAATDAVFNELIDSVVGGTSTAEAALQRAEDQLNQIIVPK